MVADVEATSDMSPLVAHYDPLLAIRLKELEWQIKRQEHENQLLRLFMILRGHDRPSSSTSAQHTVDATSTLTGVPTPVYGLSTPSVFDASKHVKLVPPFREAEADTYFTAFERVAATMRWPKDRWALLLRCRLVGKAQEVCSALPIEQRLDYEVVKTAVLRAYEWVPETYRQQFRVYVKSANQTFVEFAHEKQALFL